MHALHLVAIKHKLKASSEVSKRLSRMPSAKPFVKSPDRANIVTSPHRALLAKAMPEDDPFATQDSDSNDKEISKINQISLDALS